MSIGLFPGTKQDVDAIAPSSDPFVVALTVAARLLSQGVEELARIESADDKRLVIACRLQICTEGILKALDEYGSTVASRSSPADPVVI